MVTNNYTVRKLISKSVIKRCDIAFYATTSSFHIYWKITNFCAILLKSEFRAHLWIASRHPAKTPSPWITARTSSCARTICSTGITTNQASRAFSTTCATQPLNLQLEGGKLPTWFLVQLPLKLQLQEGGKLPTWILAQIPLKLLAHGW
jgi:hypothetical protein